MILITKILQLLSGLFNNKNLLIFVLAVAVTILILLNLKSCGDLKNQKATARQDEEAIKKELVVEKNKGGFYQTSVVAYEGKISDVQKYSEGLAKEIKDLKNRKPEVVIQTQIVYKSDTISFKDSLVNEGNGNYDLDWDYVNSDSSRVMKGKTHFNATANFLCDNKTYSLKIIPGMTSILADEFKLDFVVGVAKNTKTNLEEIFITPKNPNVHVGKLEGAILNKPKQHPFSLSAQVGYGIVYGKPNLTFGPYIGIGLSYNLLSGLFNK